MNQKWRQWRIPTRFSGLFHISLDVISDFLYPVSRYLTSLLMLSKKIKGMVLLKFQDLRYTGWRYRSTGASLREAPRHVSKPALIQRLLNDGPASATPAHHSVNVGWGDAQAGSSVRDRPPGPRGVTPSPGWLNWEGSGRLPWMGGWIRGLGMDPLSLWFTVTLPASIYIGLVHLFHHRPFARCLRNSYHDQYHKNS